MTGDGAESNKAAQWRAIDERQTVSLASTFDYCVDWSCSSVELIAF